MAASGIWICAEMPPEPKLLTAVAVVTSLLVLDRRRDCPYPQSKIKVKFRLLVAESEKVAVVPPFTLSSCWSLLSVLLSSGFPLSRVLPF
jgi:hypothetical protein